ncbi:PIN domain [Moorella glycerini]|uniref:Ribonuclease VapC20 n=1 Tax=Neomoorella stamsii TaxID=1266720 RepID=A0A9X7J528_9FIRM|nr:MULTISPECIES: PIN domain-containing protein [Moorella]PRR76043.1 Ribonuclease VapC20 [Moorella stamsii]CEP68351.1 PIN domain [Moorella glycerini]
MRVLVDSSAIAALILRNDQRHTEAIKTLRYLTEKGAVLILSNFIVAETYNLIAARAYPAKAREWLLTNNWPVERVSAHDEREARRILEKYADKDFSYTDATSFALMARFSFDLAFTYDRHFIQYGLPTQENLKI